MSQTCKYCGGIISCWGLRATSIFSPAELAEVTARHETQRAARIIECEKEIESLRRELAQAKGVINKVARTHKAYNTYNCPSGYSWCPSIEPCSDERCMDAAREYADSLVGIVLTCDDEAITDE